MKKKYIKKILLLFFIISFLFPSLTKAALTDNLVSYYKLENTTDSVGGFTLTNQGTTPFNAAKILNGADQGTSNSTKWLYTTNNLGIGSGVVSISGWVKLNTEISSSYYAFFKLSDATTNVEYSILYDYNSGTPRLIFRRNKQNVGQDEFYHTLTMGTSNWYYLTLTYDGSNLKGYVNGTYSSQVASSGNGSGVPVTQGFSIGNFYASSSAVIPSSAIFDEIGVWKRELGSTEITQLYNSGNGNQYPFSFIKSINGLTYSSAVKSVVGILKASIKSINGIQ